MYFNRIFILLLLSITLKLSSSERLHEKIYSSIEGAAACFRRLNGTHQAGCSTSEKGAVGVVQTIKEVSDAEWIVNKASAGPYMAVVSTSLFHDVIEIFMEKPSNVAGVLVYDNKTQSLDAFTEESRCPNEYVSGPGSQCSSQTAGGFVWNDRGTGLLRRDIPFPIFLVPFTRLEEITKIEECYMRYNTDKDNQKGSPLCSVQLNSFMFAAVDSRLCMRRSSDSAVVPPPKVCDPLRDVNVYYSLFPRAKETNSTKKPVILVTARIDTASLFDGVSPGAASSVVGLVTLLTTAATLSKMIPITESHAVNVLWTLFNGEAFDYIGSQRVAYDISRGEWPPASPLAPSDIKLHMEIGQMGGAVHSNASSWPITAFAPYTADIPSAVTDAIAILTETFASDLILSPVFSKNLPPSSLHSFRRILANDTESGILPELLLVDHGEHAFTNYFYNSALDGPDKINFVYHNMSIGNDGSFIPTAELLADGTMIASDMQVKISRMATALAQALYRQVTGDKYTGDIAASAHMVDEMLYCFLKSQACRLLIAADYEQNKGSEDSLPNTPVPLYVGVAAFAGTPAVFAGHLLALLTGQQLDVNHTECIAINDPNFSHYWLRGWNDSGVCMQTTMNFSQALSPAFMIPGYSFASGKYSTWTESVWPALWARVFVSASGAGARAAALTGAAATAVAALLTRLLARRHRALFPSVAPTAPGILRSVNC